MSCTRTYDDAPHEDYDRLFPFTGPERPHISYEDQDVRLGDPDAPVSAFVYPGVNIDRDVRTYRVTLTCSFGEVDILGAAVADTEIQSRYVVRYVDAARRLQTLTSNRRDSTAQTLLKNGQAHTVTFEARSGQPMYLCVNGVGPRGSSVKATISAVSTDGFTVVKPLTAHEFQNEEGIDKIKHPYCAYIILP